MSPEVITAVGVTVAAAITASATVLVQVLKLRRENTAQHAENRAITEDVRDRLLDIHTNVEHVGRKVDEVADGLKRHERDYHPGSSPLRSYR